MTAIALPPQIINVILPDLNLDNVYRKYPVQLTYVGSRIEFEFGFNKQIMAEIKSMAGAKWHGFETPPRKIWSISNCQRNQFQLACLQGENPYAWFERPIVPLEYARPLRNNQRELTDAAMTYHFHEFAAEMGCIDGDAVIHCNRAGRGFKITLADLYEKFNTATNHNGKRGQRKWDSSVTTYVRSLKGDVLGLNKIKNVLDKGIKSVLKLTLASGKSVRITPDHEICIGYNVFQPAEKLKVGDTVLSNGTWADKDGYVRVGGLKGKHPRWTTGGVYEHILVMEEKIGRTLSEKERVHHINRIRHDNRPQNLELQESDSTHATLHGREGGFKHLHGGRGRVFFVPTIDTVVSIVADGEAHVYDIVCENPHRNFVADGVIVHNCGKSLSAIEVAERAGYPTECWWVSTVSGLKAVECELKKWESQISPTLMTYEGLVKAVKKGYDKPPRVLILDEAHMIKNASAQRSQAAMYTATAMRSAYGYDCYVVEMSGTPAAKCPVDWWHQAEVLAPGFLREGTPALFERRLAFLEYVTDEIGQKYWKRLGWRDDESKCDKCGQPEAYEAHDKLLAVNFGLEFHTYTKSVNEIALLSDRLKGLVSVQFKKDYLDLPDKIYRPINCYPKPNTLRAAQMIARSADSTITALTLLRELSDGFQYTEVKDGMKVCPHCAGGGQVAEYFDPDDDERTFSSTDFLDKEVVDKLVKREYTCPTCKGDKEVVKYNRIAKHVPCPKDEALVGLLEENDEIGRIVIFAGFTGSIDRCVEIARKQQWSVIRVDGRGWMVIDPSGNQIRRDALELWSDLSDTFDTRRVAFIAHPASGGTGLTLTEASMLVYWSNTFNATERTHSSDRIHRPGMDYNRGATIVDLLHLPTDQRVLDVLKDNRRLELLSLGELNECLSI